MLQQGITSRELSVRSDKTVQLRGIDNENRGGEIRGASSAGELLRSNGGWAIDLCCRPTRQRLQDRSPGRGTPAAELPFLWFGREATDPVCAGKPEEDVRSGGKLARSRLQGAGVPHRSQRLPCVRRGVE